MDRSQTEKRYEALSPFELKDKLIEMAESPRIKMMLNAGRGNPNWVAVFPRLAFSILNTFAIEEAHRVMSRPRRRCPSQRNTDIPDCAKRGTDRNVYATLKT